MSRTYSNRGGQPAATTSTASGPTVAPAVNNAGPSNQATASGITPAGNDEGYLGELGAYEEGPEAPSHVELSTPGGSIVVDIPDDAQPGSTVSGTARSGVEGIQGGRADIQLDHNFDPVGGTVSVTVAAGPVRGTGTLSVSGGSLVGDIAVTADLGIGQGSGNARITAGGIQADGQIAAEALRLPHGVTADTSSVAWQLAGGQHSAQGQAAGQLGGLGTYALDVRYAEQQLAGDLSVQVAERSIVGEAKVLGGTLTGAFSSEAATVSGPMELGIGDWARGSTSGTYDLVAGSLDARAQATVSQATLGDVQLHSGQVDVGIEANQFVGGAFTVDAGARDFRGQAVGSYDATTNLLNATVQAQWQAGEGGAAQLGNVQVRQASGTLHIEANQATRLEAGQAQIGVLVQGEPKIDASIEAVDWDLQAGTVSGQATGNTTAPIDVGQGAASIEVQQASAAVVANQVTQVAGQASAQAGGSAEDRLIAIQGTGTLDAVTPSIPNANGDASLVRAPIELSPGLDLVGASGSASIVDDALQSASLQAQWRTDHFEGTAAGAFDGQTQTLDGSLTADLHTPMQLTGATLDRADGELGFESNTPTTFIGTAGGTVGEDFDYSAGAIDLDVGDQLLDGELDVSLQEGKQVAIGDAGRVHTLAASGDIVDSQLARVDGDVEGVFAPGGEDLLAFDVDGGFRAQDKVVESATGNVQLAGGPKQLGPVTLESLEADVAVTENQLGPINGQLGGSVGEDIAFAATGMQFDVGARQLDGQVDASLKEDRQIQVGDVGRLDHMAAQGQIEANQLTRVDGELTGTFAPGGTDLLVFALEGGYRAPDRVVEQASGDVSLAGESHTVGPLTIDRFNASGSVSENVPSVDSASVGFHTDTFRGGIETASVDLQAGTVSGTAEAELSAPVSFGSLQITRASGQAEVEANQLGTLSGEVEGTVDAGGTTVDFVAEDIELDVASRQLSGEVTASTSSHIDVLPNRLSAKIDEATGQVEANQLRQVGGDFDLRVKQGGEDVVGIDASGDYDVQGAEVTSATGEAELLRPVQLFDGKLAVEEMVAEGNVQSNELQSGAVLAVARLNAGAAEGPDAPAVQVDGRFTRADDGFDFAGDAAIEQFSVIKPNDQGRRLDGEMSGSVDTAAGTFSVEGGLEYAINENFSGELDGRMDQEFDPGFTGRLRGTADLVQSTELFSIEKTVVSVPIPPIFGASLDASLALNVDDLSVSPEIGLTEEWKPLSAATDLPDFETTTQAQWGVSLEGALIPYLYGGIRSSVVTAAIGAIGRAALSADAGIGAEVNFRGEGGVFSGDVGLGVDVGASLDLGAGVFAQLGVLGWDAVDWRKDDLVSYTLADLFSMSWSKTFTFGDQGAGEEEGGAVAQTQLSPDVSNTQTAAPTPENNHTPTNVEQTGNASVQGGPNISGDSALESVSRDDRQASGDDGEMSALDAAMQALDAMRSLHASVGGAVEQLGNFPMGTFQLIWDIFQGRFDFAQIAGDARRVFDAFDVLMEYVAPMLEGWFMGFWNYIKDGPPNLLSALFGDSSAFRDIIYDGVTLQNAPAEMLVHLLEGALWDDFWTSRADEGAAIHLLNVAASRGMIDVILTPERTRAIFEELDHHGPVFRNLVVQHAPAQVIRSELEGYVGWRMFGFSGAQEREVIQLLEAASTRGLLSGIVSQDDAENLLENIGRRNRDRIAGILRSAGYRV